MKFRHMRAMGLLPRKSDKEYSQVMRAVRASKANELQELRRRTEPIVAARRQREREGRRQANRLSGSTVCYWCGVGYDPMSPWLRRTREHVVPRSAGGGGGGNIVGAHARCNMQRGSDETWIPFAVHQRRGYRVPFDDLNPDLRLPREARP